MNYIVLYFLMHGTVSSSGEPHFWPSGRLIGTLVACWPVCSAHALLLPPVSRYCLYSLFLQIDCRVNRGPLLWGLVLKVGGKFRDHVAYLPEFPPWSQVRTHPRGFPLH